MTEEKTITENSKIEAVKTADVEVVSKEKKSTKNAASVKGKKKKTYRPVALGRAYVKSTYNNTIVTFTDQNGNVLATSSAGENGFKGPKKATPFAASIIVKKAAEKVIPYGLREVNVFVKGVGMGREAAVRAINANGINILSIKDTTPIPHNGCRRRGPRRV
jgi:small subunit ribosomal protein S11